MKQLRLTALDAQDLEIISTHMQDAVVRVGKMQFLPAAKKFILEAHRSDWLHAAETGEPTRKRAMLQFARVSGVKAKAIPQGEADYALDLLAIAFEPEAAPSGAILLSFAGGGTIRLAVECIEAQLADGSVFLESPEWGVQLSTRLGEIEEELLAALERWETLSNATP